MTERPTKSRSWRTAISFVATAVGLSLALGGTFLVPGPPAAGMQVSGKREEPLGGTPVAASAEAHDLLDGDPSQGAFLGSDSLDGDPLDGPLAGDPNAPVDQTPLEVVRSARPRDEPTTVAVYDDDPQTIWTPQADGGETWLWLDLGLEKPLREVRVLAQGRGRVEIAVSSDRQRWRDVDQIDVGGGWQGLRLRDDAQYVRLTLLPPDDGGELPAIAEAAVYGANRNRGVSTEQQPADAPKRDRNRQPRDGTKSAAAQEAQGDELSGDTTGGKESRSKGRVQTSAKPGETRCRGNGEGCEAKQGEVSVEGDCEREGTCTIDVRADGGTAVCDAAAGDETKAGGGKGRRGGSGGRCEAVADGGAVAIGDVNP
jgi:hypothetical protein